MRNLRGSIVTLSLLHFCVVMDYRARPELAPGTAIKEAEAFDLCIEHTQSFLYASGG